MPQKFKSMFFITSADSATFVMAMLTSGGDLEPKAGLKITWGVLESAVAIALLLAGGLSESIKRHPAVPLPARPFELTGAPEYVGILVHDGEFPR